MKCPKCGYDNKEDANYCSKCSHKLKDDSKLPGLEFAKETEVNEVVAFFIIGFGVLSIMLFLVPIVGGLLFAITGILQVWLMFQWMEVLNTNINNSLNILRFMDNSKNGFFKSATVSDYINKLKKSKIDMFWFWVYVLLYIFGGIFLQMIFNSEKNLQMAKNHFYSILLPEKYRFMNQIKPRNFLLVMLLTVITLGIYWYYLLIKHSSEINAFIAADQENRRHLI